MEKFEFDQYSDYDGEITYQNVFFKKPFGSREVMEVAVLLVDPVRCQVRIWYVDEEMNEKPSEVMDFQHFQAALK